jgi:hypothetical protein
MYSTFDMTARRQSDVSAAKAFKTSESELKSKYRLLPIAFDMPQTQKDAIFPPRYPPTPHMITCAKCQGGLSATCFVPSPAHPCLLSLSLFLSAFVRIDSFASSHLNSHVLKTGAFPKSLLRLTMRASERASEHSKAEGEQDGQIYENKRI